MSKSIQNKIIETIKQYPTIIIHRHQRPDPDAVGSQCGLRELIKNTFPSKKVLAAGSSPGSLRFLAEMDRVKDEDYTDSLVIVTDTANAGRIDDERYSQSDRIIKIDHHPSNPDGNYAHVTWEEPGYSSCSEMIGELWLNNQEELKINDAAARLLYAGIVGDTNRFLYNATSPQTMRIAADLMTYDFDHTELNDTMNRIGKKEAQLMGYVLNNLTILESGTAYIVIDQELLEELGIKDEHTQSIVSLPRQIEGVLTWGVFVQQEDGSYRCRLRSSGPVINHIAAEHDGGGHAMASGANAEDLEEIHVIIDKLSKEADSFRKD